MGLSRWTLAPGESRVLFCRGVPVRSNVIPKPLAVMAGSGAGAMSVGGFCGSRFMKIAITGGRGRIGRALTDGALARGHSVVNIDRVEAAAPPAEGEVAPPLPEGDVVYLTADATDYDALLAAFAGCDA